MANIVDTQNSENTAETTAARTGASLITVIWQRKSLVILGLVIGLVLGSLFYAQRTPVYQSVASILVVKKSLDNVVPSGGQSAMTMVMDDYMSTQTSILRSFKIAEKAALSDEIKQRFDQDGGMKSFPEAKNPSEIVSDILTNLTVTRENRDTINPLGNNVIVLTFKGTDRDECKVVLDNIIRGYQQFLDETYKAYSDNIIRQINDARGDLEKRIQRADADYEKFLSEENSVLSLKTFTGTSVFQKELSGLAEEITRLKQEVIRKKTQLENINRIRKEQGPADVNRYIFATSRALMDTGNAELDKAIQGLRMRESELRGSYGPNHPQVKQVQRQIEILREFYVNMGDQAAKDKANVKVDPSDPAEAFTKTLAIDLESNENLLAKLQSAYEKTTKEAQTLNHVTARDEKLKDERDRARVLWRKVSEAIDTADLKKGGGFTANAITPATIGRKVSPNPYQVFTAAAMLGMLLGVGLAYLAEISDKSFRNPQEIRRRLGLPVIGHIPFLAPDEKAQQLVSAGATTIDPMLITHYQSNSIGAEAYRGVRTALYFSTQGAGHQVIQVTSPNVSDGKSTLAANLAASIAQSGKRTLLIDCDFRKPRVHKIFNVSAHCGMASVMAGQADLASATQPTGVPNLSVMPCGPRPANPAELLTSPKFTELIEELRRQYDFVVVDTPPILVVTDPAVVAPRVDGVVLCIRVTKNGRPYAERAREVLGSLGANILGVVVNGFGTQVGGNRYGYEHYQYGYGEGYAYSYTYGYADKEAASYYGTEVDEVPAQATKS